MVWTFSPFLKPTDFVAGLTLLLNSAILQVEVVGMGQHSTAYVRIPAWDSPEDPFKDTDDFENPFPIGQRIQVRHDRTRDGKVQTGKVIAWARAKDAHDHWTQFHPAGHPTCEFGDRCDMLCDNEGPLVLWDGSTEDIDWYPGQSMGGIDPV